MKHEVPVFKSYVVFVALSYTGLAVVSVVVSQD